MKRQKASEHLGRWVRMCDIEKKNKRCRKESKKEGGKGGRRVRMRRRVLVYSFLENIIKHQNAMTAATWLNACSSASLPGITGGNDMSPTLPLVGEGRQAWAECNEMILKPH